MACGIILAGGFGTRLAPVLPHIPKTLAPIQKTPFLCLLLQQLADARILSKIVLALGYKAENIRHFLQQQLYPLPIEFSIETTPLGTGGALLHALDKINDETLLVLNGDSYFDLSLSDFLNFHRAKNSDITIACRELEDTSRYGAIELDPSSHRITSFREKSPIPLPGWINAGIYLIEKRLLDAFPLGAHSLEKDFFPQFLKKNIFAYCHNGSFIDIGTPNSYTEAQEILKPWIPA